MQEKLLGICKKGNVNKLTQEEKQMFWDNCDKHWTDDWFPNCGDARINFNIEGVKFFIEAYTEMIDRTDEYEEWFLTSDHNQFRVYVTDADDYNEKVEWNTLKGYYDDYDKNNVVSFLNDLDAYIEETR